MRNTIHFSPDLVRQNIFRTISFQFAPLPERKASKLMAALIVYASERNIKKKNLSNVKRNADLLKEFNLICIFKMGILKACQKCV
jgi:hypothetical protein